MPTKLAETIDQNAKNFLTTSEMKKFLEAARKGRHGVRDYCLMLTAYRHGLFGGFILYFHQNICSTA